MAFSSLDLPWAPAVTDLESPKNIRGVKTKVDYASLQECADIHYQLLKEDFMHPIRDGVERFRTSKEIHSSGLRFYFNVRIVDIMFFDKIQHRLQFDSSKINFDQGENCLTTGSLLLLSCNNFETFVCAVVTNRQKDLLTHGVIDVEFIPDRNSLSHLLASLSGIFVMAESKMHYPSYSHVLPALKQAKICSRLQENIIKDSLHLERPAYLSSKAKYDMSCIMNDKKPCNFEPLKSDAWPDIRQTCLNEAQKKAVQLALTKELAIIQGPPGTGKTFICLKIIEALLKNSKNFKSPVLVMCKTNDALDEILEGLLEFCTSKIIHFGGKSKSSKLEMYNIDSVKKEMEERQVFSKDLQSKYWEYAQMLAKISEQIAEFYHQLECLETEVMPPEVLLEHMNHNHREAVKRGRWTVKSMSDWLRENKSDINVNDKNSSKDPICMKVLQEVSNNTLLPMSEKEEMKAKNIKMLTQQQKFALYKLWVNKHRKQLSEKLAALFEEYSSIHDKVSHLRKQKTAEVLQSATVIGITTSVATRHSWELRAVKCKVVLIEEAAKVIESHIIAALNQWCEHLILIGDHQLMGPTPAFTQLMNDCGLSISLFERLIKNGIPYVQLNEQYKMCPSISKLMHCIYPKFKDHKSVLKQNDILGVSKNVFFINHIHKGERHCWTRSTVRICETNFLIAFCKYLLFQGVAPSSITILTTNVNQMLTIKKKMNNVSYDHPVLVTTVNRYSNRESDIILLSFLRSREEIRTGIPVAVNQISLAFSRATRGFYAIGDFESLKSQSETWSAIIDSAYASGAMGTGLLLSCGLTAGCAEEFNMYISYRKLQAVGPISLKYDLTESFPPFHEIQVASIQIKLAYCLLKIEQMDGNRNYRGKFIAWKENINNIVQSLTYKEKEKFRLDLACLLYLVVITELEHLFSSKRKKNESQKLLMKRWIDKLFIEEVDLETLDAADDFVETMMLSMIKANKRNFCRCLTRAREIDTINAVLFSEDNQMLCDFLEGKPRREKPRKQKQPLRTASRKKAGKVIHGRQLQWFLADK